MEDLLLKLAEIGGPTVVVVMIFIAYLWQKDKMYNKTMNNHLQHETASRDRLTAALTSLAEVVRGCPNKNK